MRPPYLEISVAQSYIKSTSITQLRNNAMKIRRKNYGGGVTFSKNITLDLSHICRNRCAYCYFRAAQNPLPSDFLLPDAVIQERISRARELGCKEVLITSGENPGEDDRVAEALKERGFDSYIEFVANVSERCLDAEILPHTNVGVISDPELKRIAPLNASMGLMLESTRRDFCEPEGPHANSPGKEPRMRLDFIERAGCLNIAFTTGILVGLGETMNDRVEAFVYINQLQEKYRHIQEVIIQNFVPQPGTRLADRPSPSWEEFSETVLVGRNILSPEISIQVAPNLVKGHETELLKCGVNDFGGISPLTKDFINPFHPWPEEVRLAEICSREGFLLRERLPIYDHFLNHEDFLSPRVREIAHSLRSSIPERE